MPTLPQRPRLRASFWYEGDALKCELVLMSDRRELVHRETIAVAPGSALERTHAAFCSTVAQVHWAKSGVMDLRSGLPLPAEPAPPAPAREPGPTTEERMQARQARLDELAARPQAEPELEPVAEPGPELEPVELTLEQRAQAHADRVARLTSLVSESAPVNETPTTEHPPPVTGETMIENREPEPPSEPPQIP